MYSENEPDNENQSDDEERFVKAAHELRDKYNVIMNKYQQILMKESMVGSLTHHDLNCDDRSDSNCLTIYSLCQFFSALFERRNW